jgi:hypothetical protein
MLSLRLAIFGLVAGIALWSLFSLLDMLREPELLRSTKAIVVKGCDPIESDEATRACPALFCQKALLDARTVSLRVKFSVSNDKRAGERHLITGAAANDATAQSDLYACVLERNKVVSAKLVDATVLEDLARQDADWELAP